MMFKHSNRWLISLIAIAPALLVACTPSPAPSVDVCMAEKEWIDRPSQPDGAAFKPTSNCAFHQWSYQTFLWLVSPDSNSETSALIFEGFANPKNLFMPAGPKVGYPGGATGALMLPRMRKSQTTADIEDIFQAGPGKQVLVDQAGNIVYYANHLNRKYWEFVVSKKLYDPVTLKAVEPGSGSDGSPSPEFVIDSLELKSSWRVASHLGEKTFIPDADKRFYVVETEIPLVAPNSQGIWTRTGETKTARMALVGIHVVGIVDKHHEFIWATFEHVDNAPNCAELPKEGHWNFYNGTATQATANQYDPANPTAPVSVCRTHPNGGGNDDNQSAITSLNKHVKELEGGSLSSNYFLGGGVWTTGKREDDAGKIATLSIPLNNGAFSPEDSDAGAKQLGSLDLANTSMETFTQEQNCFACHNGGAHTIELGDDVTRVNAKNVNLSHFVVNYQAKQQIDPTPNP